MSRFSGPQKRGMMRTYRAEKRAEAIERNKAYQKRLKEQTDANDST